MNNVNSVNNSNSNNGTAKMQRYYALNTMKTALQSSLGDIGKSSEFDLMFDALLDSISDDSSDLSKMLDSAMGNTSDTTSDGATTANVTGKTFNTSAGEILNNIDMKSIDSLGYLNINSYIKNANSSTSSTSLNPEIKSLIDKYSSEYGVDSNLVSNLINAESSYNSNAESSAGAKGLMQLMPSVCSEMGVTNPFDPAQNIKAGVRLLKQHLDKYDGDVAMALMAYNAGAGTVASRGVTSAKDLYKMPTETQNYVKKILTACKA